jgi:hypothetical protein
MFNNKGVCSCRSADCLALVLALSRNLPPWLAPLVRTMEHLSQRLGDIVAELGDSADEIAAALDRHQIWGVRNTVRFLNPIVRYVQQELGIGPFNADLTDPETIRVALDGTTIRTGLRQPIRDFLDAFNDGAYPELEADGVAGRLEVLAPSHG